MMCIHLSVENMNLFAIKNCCKICNVTLLATPAHGVQANWSLRSPFLVVELGNLKQLRLTGPASSSNSKMSTRLMFSAALNPIRKHQV